MASKKSGKDMATYKHMAKTPGKDNMYNAKGSPEEGEAMDEEAGMKRGGKAKKRKHGGMAEGHKSKHRADKLARGGKAHHSHEAHGHAGHHHSKATQHKEMHKRASGGRTPYTSGHMTSEPTESGMTNSGHESQRPSS